MPGGNTAHISFVNNKLIIGGNTLLHHDVADLLRSLREADANTPIDLQK